MRAGVRHVGGLSARQKRGLGSHARDSCVQLSHHPGVLWLGGGHHGRWCGCDEVGRRCSSWTRDPTIRSRHNGAGSQLISGRASIGGLRSRGSVRTLMDTNPLRVSTHLASLPVHPTRLEPRSPHRPLVLSRTSGGHERSGCVFLRMAGHRGGAWSGMRSNLRETPHAGDQVRRGGSRGL